MPDSFLHKRNDFRALVATVADSKKINHAALVEKDYWIMHAVYGLKQLGLTFELNGGTSLSKGFGIIQRFSFEDEKNRKQFEAEYSKTAPLYYRGQIPLDKILARIQHDLARL